VIAATGSALELTRDRILAHRRRAGALEERLPAGADSLRVSAWVGLQDSMPRAALLSIHARVAGTQPSTWEDPSLVQLWGPRYSAYVVAAPDVAIFTLGRLPDEPRARKRAEDIAVRLGDVLGGRTMRYGEAGHALGIHPNAIRYAAPTGRLRLRWDGARQPLVWMTSAPDVDPFEAREELARRYLHVFGPANGGAFATWAGIRPRAAHDAWVALASSLMRARTPIGEAWILAEDEEAFRAGLAPPAGVRLLPSGDAYFLLHGSDRELLVPDARRRPYLWTSRVWPGAVLVGGEVAGTWRRNEGDVTIQPWRTFTSGEREAVEVEAASLPLPGLRRPITVVWEE
jgi:hypothetical protein